MFRKILCSIIYVAGFNDPVGQIVGLFIIYLFYFLYIAISRPFIQNKYNVISIITEFIMLLIHFMFLLMASNDNDAESQVNYMTTIFILMLIQFIVTALFGLIQLCLIIFEYFS